MGHKVRVNMPLLPSKQPKPDVSQRSADGRSMSTFQICRLGNAQFLVPALCGDSAAVTVVAYGSAFDQECRCKLGQIGNAGQTA